APAGHHLDNGRCLRVKTGVAGQIANYFAGEATADHELLFRPSSGKVNLGGEYRQRHAAGVTQGGQQGQNKTSPSCPAAGGRAAEGGVVGHDPPGMRTVGQAGRAAGRSTPTAYQNASATARRRSLTFGPSLRKLIVSPSGSGGPSPGLRTVPPCRVLTG